MEAKLKNKFLRGLYEQADYNSMDWGTFLRVSLKDFKGLCRATLEAAPEHHREFLIQRAGGRTLDEDKDQPDPFERLDHEGDNADGSDSDFDAWGSWSGDISAALVAQSQDGQAPPQGPAVLFRER